MSHKMSVKFGLILVLSAILVAWVSNHWYTTRIFNPLELNVLLEGDRTQTAEFTINLRETYWVGIDVGYRIDDYIKGNCSSNRLNSLRWKVFRIGKDAKREQEPWADSDYFRHHGMYSDQFRANPGKYQVDWQVSPEATCLNSRHPRLSIETSSEDSDEMVEDILFVCLLVALPAAGLLMHGLGGLFVGLVGIGHPLRMFPDLVLRNVLPIRRRSPLPLIVNLPIFAPVWISILAILVTIFMIMLSTRLAPTGFIVHLDKSRTTVWEKSPWPETMSVYVDGSREFYVNGRHVAPQDLPERLKEELGKRMDWTVYFEADETVRFSDAEYAMKTVQDLGAKLIWLTPKTREELNQKVAK
jgi:biopolymer transport protein ExbD